MGEPRGEDPSQGRWGRERNLGGRSGPRALTGTLHGLGRGLLQALATADLCSPMSTAAGPVLSLRVTCSRAVQSMRWPQSGPVGQGSGAALSWEGLQR